MVTDRYDAWVRRASAALTVIVGLIAATLSYRHQYGLAHGHDESVLAGALWPLSVDGLLAMGTLALLAAARRGSGRRWPRAAVALGVAMTLWANTVHGLGSGPAGVAVAGWPPVALIVAVEVLASMLRRPDTADTAPELPGLSQPPPVYAEVGKGRRQDIIRGTDNILRYRTLVPDTAPDIADTSPDTPDTAPDIADTAPDIADTADTADTPAARAVRLRGQGLTPADIAGQLDVSDRTIRRYLSAANGHANGTG